MADRAETIRLVYERFNSRDIDGVLALLHADVDWANGMEGGHVHGHEEVRRYWTRQWAMIDPHVEPVDIAPGPDGEVVVEGHQTVSDLAGNPLSNRMVGHIFRIEDGLIRRFDIRGA
jgi:ketosteroid isomerase-like protein